MKGSQKPPVQFWHGFSVLVAAVFTLFVAGVFIIQCRCDRRWAEKKAQKANIKKQKARGPHLTQLRQQMVSRQIVARGVKDPRVLAAMKKVKRHLFVPSIFRDSAYQDRPLSIGYSQTISQPYIVARMTEALKVTENDKVLEVGTGSGYQAAILAELVKNVYTIEIVKPLAEEARRALNGVGYKNIHFKVGDGYAGWPTAAPFDAIIVTAMPDHVPQPLKKQLKVGGRLVMPVDNVLVRITRTKKGYKDERLLTVQFVPMTGQAQKR